MKKLNMRRATSMLLIAMMMVVYMTTPVFATGANFDDVTLPIVALIESLLTPVLAIVGAVVALGVLAVVLLTSLGVDLLPKPNTVQKKDNYTVSDEKAEHA